MIWATPCKNVSWAHADSDPDQPAQSDQGRHCPLTEPLDAMECMTGEQRPRL